MFGKVTLAVMKKMRLEEDRPGDWKIRSYCIYLGQR